MGLNSQLARFAVQSNHFKSGQINPKLFRPNKEMQVSVFRIEDKTKEDIIEEGKNVVSEHKTSATLYGWAKIAAKEVLQIGLEVDDDDDPPGHSNIVGWPEDEGKILRYQQDLSKASERIELPDPISVPKGL